MTNEEFMELVDSYVELEKMNFEKELNNMISLMKFLGINNQYKIKCALEFAELFKKFNKNGWIEMK